MLIREPLGPELRDHRLTDFSLEKISYMITGIRLLGHASKIFVPTLLFLISPPDMS